MEQKNYRVLLSEKQFLKLILANVVSRFGDSLDVIAYTWIMYEVTGSESLMALIMGLNYVPTVLLQPFAGALSCNTYLPQSTIPLQRRKIILCRKPAS